MPSSIRHRVASECGRASRLSLGEHLDILREWLFGVKRMLMARSRPRLHPRRHASGVVAVEVVDGHPGVAHVPIIAKGKLLGAGCCMSAEFSPLCVSLCQRRKTLYLTTEAAPLGRAFPPHRDCQRGWRRSLSRDGRRSSPGDEGFALDVPSCAGGGGTPDVYRWHRCWRSAGVRLRAD